MSSSTIQNPQDVLLAASGAVAAKDYSKAAALFTELMERWPQIPKQLPMLSRSTCFMETKEYSKALSDVIAVLQQEDVQVAEEIIPNCFSTRVAAATRAAQIYTALKDNEKATLYKKLATELVELSAHTADQAQQLKEEGNGFYKQSRLREALERYQKALKLDPANASILGNITQTLIRLDRLTDARQYANRCAAVQPEWPKAWYRKGMIELKLGNLVDALSAFQQGLAHAPDDVDLKRIYLETSKKAEKASPAKGGLDQHFLGMMMDLRHNSWSVAEWFKTQSAHIQYWDMSRFDPASYAAAQNSARFKSIVTRIASFASNSFQQGLSAEATLGSLLQPDDPLLSLLMVLALFCELYPSKRYDLVWTFSAPGAAFAQSDILVPVSRHQTFGFLVDRVSKEIVDPFSFYGKAPDQLGKVTSFVPKCMDCDADGSVTWYTCGDLPKLCEFFESYYTSQGLGRTKGAGSKSGNTLGPQSKSANALRDDDGGSDSDSDDRTGDGDQSEDDDRIDDNGQNEDHDEEESDGDTVEDDDEGAGDDADNGISVQTVPVPIPRQASQQTPGQPKSAAVAAATTSKPLSHRIAVEVGSGLVLLLAFFVYFYASGWAGR